MNKVNTAVQLSILEIAQESLAKSGLLCASDLKNETQIDDEQDVDRYAIALNLSRKDVVRVFVFWRTMIHNWIVEILLKKSQESEKYQNVLMIFYSFALWLDRSPEIFFSLSDVVAEGRMIKANVPQCPKIDDSALTITMGMAGLKIYNHNSIVWGFIHGLLKSLFANCKTK